MNDRFKGYINADKALQMIIDLTGDLGCCNSLSEKLQLLLDLPCEYCNDGKAATEQQQKIERLTTLLHNSLTLIEEQSCANIIGTDLEDEIGITREEYNEIMGYNENDSGLNTQYDCKRYEYKIVIECVKSGKEYYNEYEPKSQGWEDIIKKYNFDKEKLMEEIKDNFCDCEELEWLLNDYQPITQFKCKNGDWYEIYVMANEK